MTDEEIRQSIVHLLRAYFDKSTNVDPLDTARTYDVAGAHMSALADIILYTSNPILYYTCEESTHATAGILLTNSTLRFKLPEPLISMIAYRHSRTNIMDNEIIKIAADIVYSAKKNQEFWEKKRDGLLQWGRCPIQDSDTYYRYRNNAGPLGIEGWIPVIIEHQDIWIRRNQFNMYDWGLADRDQIIRPDSLKVHLHGNHNNYTPRYVSRELLSKCPSLYGINSDINEDDWIKVILLQQRTWIYFNSKKITILPKSSVADSYIKFTTAVSFPHSRGCTFFAERNTQGSAFINYPPETPLFVNDNAVPLFVDEDAPAPVPPDLTTQTVVVGTSDITHGFQETYGDEDEDVLPDYIFWRQEYETAYPSERVSRLCDLVEIFDRSPYTNRKKTFMTILNRISRDTGDIHRGAWISWNTHEHNTPRKFVLLSELIIIYKYHSFNYENTAVDIHEYISRLFVDLNTFSQDVLRAHEFITESDDEAVDPPPRPITLPKRIRDIILADVIAKGDECSIIMEPLTAENLAITSCFHFFDKDAIQKWIQGNDTCPQCRERTTVYN